jgi:hypothetical protein
MKEDLLLQGRSVIETIGPDLGGGRRQRQGVLIEVFPVLPMVLGLPNPVLLQEPAEFPQLPGEPLTILGLA